MAVALDAVVAELRKQHPEIKTEVSYGSSGLFFEQLLQKAPYDIYMSSDPDFPRQLVERGLALKGSQFRYARGTLALFVAKSSPVNVESLGIQSLLQPGVRKIAIADPAHTPSGRASEAALERLNVMQKVQSKLLPCHDTAQAARLVDTGTADAALIGTALAGSLAAKNRGRYWQLPLDSYPPIIEEGVVMASAKSPEAATLVRDYIVSPEGRAIFQRLGFILPL